MRFAVSGTGDASPRRLYAIIPAAGEFQEPKVAKDLELLADFGLEVFVLRVQPGKRGRESVNLAQREFVFAQLPHNVQHVERPAAGAIAFCLKAI